MCHGIQFQIVSKYCINTTGQLYTLTKNWNLGRQRLRGWFLPLWSPEKILIKFFFKKHLSKEKCQIMNIKKKWKLRITSYFSHGIHWIVKQSFFSWAHNNEFSWASAMYLRPMQLARDTHVTGLWSRGAICSKRGGGNLDMGAIFGRRDIHCAWF